MKYIEVPDGRVREAGSGCLWLDVGNDEWVPVMQPRVRLVELRDVMADPASQVIVSRAALAVVLNYAYHTAGTNPDVQLRAALLELHQRIQS